MRLHESAREDVGWVMVLVGVVALLLGVIDLWLMQIGASVLSAVWDGVLIVLGAAVAVVGLYLHVTRSRVRDVAASTAETPAGHQTAVDEGESPETAAPRAEAEQTEAPQTSEQTQEKGG